METVPSKGAAARRKDKRTGSKPEAKAPQNRKAPKKNKVTGASSVDSPTVQPELEGGVDAAAEKGSKEPLDYEKRLRLIQVRHAAMQTDLDAFIDAHAQVDE
ncbi:MAG: hypothetical protein V1918_04200 [Planctomycetota bacterium]